jgi:hypothetical protein
MKFSGVVGGRIYIVHAEFGGHMTSGVEAGLSITCSSGRLTAFRIGSMPKLAPKQHPPY